MCAHVTYTSQYNARASPLRLQQEVMCFPTKEANPMSGQFGSHKLWHIAVMVGAFIHWYLILCYVTLWEPLAL